MVRAVPRRGQEAAVNMSNQHAGGSCVGAHALPGVHDARECPPNECGAAGHSISAARLPETCAGCELCASSAQLPCDAPLIIMIGEEGAGLCDIARAMHVPAVLAALPVSDWNAELTPWPAPELRREQPFSGGADATLERVRLALPALREALGRAGLVPRASIIMGYSLAGLCALWCATRMQGFDGAASISGSMWYDGFCDYLSEHAPHVRAAYLSLGDAEPRARNERLRRVGECTLQTHSMLCDAGINAHFDWNKGNHFTDVHARVARGADWLCEACSG